MIIDSDTLDELQDAIDNGDDRLYLDYSGRGMYGATCLGIVTDNPAMVGITLTEVLGADAAREIVSHTRTDSMGMSTIVYFPGVQVEGYEREARF